MTSLFDKFADATVDAFINATGGIEKHKGKYAEWQTIAKCEHDKDYHYSGAWHGGATAILDCVKLEDVGKLP